MGLAPRDRKCAIRTQLTHRVRKVAQIGTAKPIIQLEVGDRSDSLSE